MESFLSNSGSLVEATTSSPERTNSPLEPLELLSPFSCFYLEPVWAYPLRVVDFMRAVIVSEQPGAVLGHASRLRCAAEDVEEERRIGSLAAAAEFIEDSTGGKKVFNWERKKMGKWTFVS